MFDQVKNVYVTGIGGIGVSAIARLFLAQGATVAGSDLSASANTELLVTEGITVHLSQVAQNIAEEIQLHIYSSAVPPHNPERQRIAELGIPSYSYNEFLGLLSNEYKTIAVSGTNGKTTTTAMLSHILVDGGLDPTCIVGSIVPEWKSNWRLGASDLLVLEACEHKAHMMTLHPEHIVLTNIEADHLDFYKDLDHIKQTFREYIGKLPEAGKLVFNADDIHTVDVVGGASDISFGKASGAIRLLSISSQEGYQEFRISYGGQEYMGKLVIPATFNIYNALAALAMAVELGVDVEQALASLEKFKGTWRRFEHVATYNEVNVYSDYAHHPTAVKATIAGARDFFPSKEIVAVFQPHHHSRTKELFDDFIHAFEGADKVVLVDIFDVAGREEDDDQDVSTEMLIEAISQEYPDIQLVYTPGLEDLDEYLRDELHDGQVCLVMGAGDAYQVAENLAG
jgi:UDP-N-acetylmuramate--alanine ligase